MRPLMLLTAGVLLVSGCGGLADPRAASDVPSARPMSEAGTIPGTRVGSMAEHELEVMDPGMAIGRIHCPDLSFVVGRSVRCERIAQLSGGRWVRVGGTVTVTGVASGGRLHVQLDDAISGFGVTGRRLAADLRAALAGRRAAHTSPPGAVHCPALLGRTGQTVRCSFRLDGRLVRIRVVATGVTPSTSTTRYRFAWRSLPGPVQRSLAYVATEPSAMVDLVDDHRGRAAA